MPKDYYLILGITSDASLDDIKEAYRRLAKAYHPDRYGENNRPFIAIQEAYSVLSDPIKRQTHDLEVLNQKKKAAPPFGRAAGSGRAGDVEPLIPGQPSPMDRGPQSPARSSLWYHTPLDDWFDRIFTCFRQGSRQGRRTPQSPQVTIRLTPEQAFDGGQIKLSLPAEFKCPSCSGRGGVGPYPCWRCSGQGVLSGQYPVMISFPPGTPDHHRVRLPLNVWGIGPSHLMVHFRVGDGVGTCRP